jgi:predicted deacylase
MDKQSITYSLIGVLTLAVLVGVLLWSGLLDTGQDSLLSEDQPPIQAPTSSTSTTDQAQQTFMSTSTIGQSVGGRDISTYTFGDGATHLLFVGGIHGGYEWNSVVLAYNLIDYLQANPNILSDNLTVSVIPNMNPDAVYDVVGKTGSITKADVPTNADPGGPERFNANGVDLNRNFDCNWQTTSQWRGQGVNAGSGPFSEPETRALRDYVQSHNLSAAVFFHSAAGAVYGAACNGAVGPQTKNLLNTYAQASGYRSVDKFDAYPVTGDVESWLTKQGIPAVSVELTNHQDVEWQKNLSGIEAVLSLYSRNNE